MGDRQQLRAPADRERRQRPLARGRDQRELPVVGAGVRLVGVLELGAVRRRVDVAAAGDEQPVGQARAASSSTPRQDGRDTTSGSPPASTTRAAYAGSSVSRTVRSPRYVGSGRRQHVTRMRGRWVRLHTRLNTLCDCASVPPASSEPLRPRAACSAEPCRSACAAGPRRTRPRAGTRNGAGAPCTSPRSSSASASGSSGVDGADHERLDPAEVLDRGRRSPPPRTRPGGAPGSPRRRPARPTARPP